MIHELDAWGLVVEMLVQVNGLIERGVDKTLDGDWTLPQCLRSWSSWWWA